MKSKELLLSFLALYSMSAAYAETSAKVNTKYDKIYNNLVNGKGVSSKDYGFLEEVLNKRNKELKDLYEQSDYIVKPEYLEWQVFFSGFYDHIERGDNTSASAKYHSDPEYKKSSIQGKLYQGKQVSKTVDLGIRISMKDVSRAPLDLGIIPPEVISINPAGEITINRPDIAVPEITVPSFQMVNVNVANVEANNVLIKEFDIKGSANEDAQAIINYGTGSETVTFQKGTDSYPSAILAQQSLSGVPSDPSKQGTFDITVKSDNKFEATIEDTSATGKTASTSVDNGLLNNTWTPSSSKITYVMKLVGGANGVKLDIDNMNITYTGKNAVMDNRFLFFLDAHNKNPGATVIDNQWNISQNSNITLKGQNAIMFGIQYHGSQTDHDGGNAGMINNGTILASNDAVSGTTPGNRIIFTTIESYPNNTNHGDDDRELYFINNGNLQIDGENDIIGHFAVPSDQQVAGTKGGTMFTNNGVMKVNGLNAIGIVVQDKGQKNNINNFGISSIKLNNALELTGDNSLGLYIKNSNFNSNMSLSQINMNIGFTGNKSATVGNKLGGDTNFAEGITGIYTDSAKFTVNAGNSATTDAIGTHKLLFGSQAKNSSLVRADGGEITVTGAMEVGKGSDNVGIISYLSGKTILADGATLEIKGGTNNSGVYVQNGGTFTNDGTITASAATSNGVITAAKKNDKNVMIKGNVINTGTINKEESGAAVVLAGGDFSSTGTITTRKGSAGLYTNINALANEVFLAGGGIIAENGGIAFYTGTSGEMKFRFREDPDISTPGDIVATIKNGGLAFYNVYVSNNGSAVGTYGKYNVSGPTNIKIENGGSAFGIKSSNPVSSDFTNYLTNVFGSSISNLGIEMPTNPGELGNLFVLDHTSLDLTNTESVVNTIRNGSLITNLNGNYRFALVTDSTLNIDNSASIGHSGAAYNLDDSNDLINQITAVNSLVNITSGTYITGTQDNQVLVKQTNKALQSQNAIAIVNDGNITMSGTNSVSLYSVFGDIQNNGKITISNNAIGILGLNNTKILNSGTGEINVGNNSVGIAGVTYNGVNTSIALGYGNDKVDISNTGIINDISGHSKAVGIYAENKNATVNRSDVQAVNTGVLNFANSANSVAAYITGGTFTNTGGQIKVGNGNVGIYADNSDVSFNSGTIELGSNATGFYLDNSSDLNVTSGTINVTGQNAVIYNINGSGSNINNNWTINSSAGASYIFANINSGVYQTTGNYSLANNSVVFSGINSAVILDSNGVITGSGTNNVALYSTGQYSGALPAPYTVESENQGIITMGDLSAGIYTVNGARALNALGAKINAGNSSVGMYGMNSGTVTNAGDIEIGTLSQGIYAQNTGNIINSGTIKGVNASTVGIYAEGNMDITNDGSGRIDLSGNDSIGIFSKYAASSTAILTNNGTINIGNSTNAANPGLGIYSENIDEKIINNGTITVGSSSLGIYKAGSATGSGAVDQKGEITVGNGGIGIYSDGDAVNIYNSSVINLLGGNETAGVYGVNGAKITNDSSSINIGAGNYGFILNSGASFENNAAITLGNKEVLVYSDGGSTITNNGKIKMTGFENIAVYSVNGEIVTNTQEIDGSGGIGNIAVYNKGGIINNSGDLILGKSDIQSKTDTSQNTYAVGLYGENSSITNLGDIYAGANAVGIYTKTDKNHTAVSINKGNIYLPDGAVGLYAEGANTQIINDTGAVINVSGKESIGMAAVGGALITNKGTINITGTSSYGMYGNASSKVENYGTINVDGENNIAILLAGGSELVNNAQGTINIINGSINADGLAKSINGSYFIPSIVNSGVINVNENFSVNGVEVSIKVDPATIRAAILPEDAGAKFVSDSVKFNAPAFSVDENNPVVITPDFLDGTNASVYKLKDVFNPTTPGGGPNTGSVPVVSRSLTWEAIPQVNSNGNVDIWMRKIPYDKFTSGLWYEDFGKNLDKKYGVDGISAKAVNIFNKIDYISDEADFRNVMAGLAGNIYANINQREEDIAGIFENSLDLLQNSKNNTKENVKINVIAGEGKRKEETDGVVGYDYKATGIQALREVERTYRHTFGYSLGYMHTGFEFNDGNESEEWVDTIQMGLHNKYKANDWVMRNDLTGRASIHNIDRNLDWTRDGRSEMNGTYETYSLTFDNSVGKEFKIGKNSSVKPYGGLRAMYAVRPSFTESGLEALEVDGNDAWSVKPRAGVEIKGEMPLGARGWKAKATLDLAYEYELADLNEREQARLISVEDGYHNLSKPEEEKGAFRSKASIGIEVEEKYGAFVTGEYVTGEHSQEDYRIGVNLKAVF